MADIYYTNNVYTPEPGIQDQPPEQEAPLSSLGGAFRVLGAVGSLALMVGVGVWGYQLIIRDVSGVPVVRALEGPMRIQPKDPGGRQADHQGLAVNAIAAAGTAAPTADRVMLAPRPVELTDEDMPAGQIAPQAAPATVRQDGSAEVALASLSVEALVEQLTDGVAPISGQESPIGVASQAAVSQDVQPDGLQPDTAAAEQPGEAEPAALPQIATGPGLARSLRPHARPARAVPSAGSDATDPVLVSAINAAVDTVARLEVDPASLPVGTRLAQLGAYDSVEIARAEWDRLNLRFEEYLEGKKRVIQKASSGGRTFYRLRAMGFDDLSAARRFCSALVSENTDCIPVTIR